MKITKEWLKEKKACSEGVKWFKKQDKTDIDDICRQLLKENHFNWANWTLIHNMTYKQHVSYAVYAAELVLHIFEEKFPDDKRPRIAIEAAKKCIENPPKKNKELAKVAHATDAAADAAADAANAAHATHAAADAAYTAADAKIKPKIIEYGIKLLEVNHEI